MVLKVLGALFLVSSVAFAGLETKLNPKIGPDGRAGFGIQYAYDTDKAWTLTYTSDISAEVLRNAPQSLQWNFLNVTTGQYLQGWTPAGRGELKVGSVSLSAIKPLFQFLVEMKSYRLVFADENLTTIFYFDIGELCADYPQNVVDLSNTANPACEVLKSQLPDLENECREQREQFSELLKRGLLTCKIANAQLAKRGCEPLDCK